MLNATMSGKIFSAQIDTNHPVNIMASWCETDPIAMHLSFVPEGFTDSIDWVFARALLLEALGAPDEWVGEGDVTLKAGLAGELQIQLMSPEGAARISTPSFMLAHMAQQSCGVIEPSSPAETAIYAAQFDAEIAGLIL